MKTKQILELVMIAALAGGCNWDMNAVLGGNPERPVPVMQYDYGSSVCATQTLKVDQQTVAQGCSVPRGIAAFDITDRGVIHVWVKQLGDGSFPMIPSLIFSYSRSGYETDVPFDCVSGQLAADGRTAELICSARTSKPVSGYNLRSTDSRLRIRSIVLRNPDCTSWISFKRDRDAYMRCNDPYYDGSPVMMGDVMVPDLWIDDTSSRPSPTPKPSPSGSPTGGPVLVPPSPWPSPVPPMPPVAPSPMPSAWPSPGPSWGW